MTETDITNIQDSKLPLLNRTRIARDAVHRTVKQLVDTPLLKYDLAKGTATLNKLRNITEGLAKEVKEEMGRWEIELQGLFDAFVSVPKAVEVKLGKLDLIHFQYGVKTEGRLWAPDVVNMLQAAFDTESLRKLLAEVIQEVKHHKEQADKILEATIAAEIKLRNEQDELKRIQKEERERKQAEKEEKERERREKEEQERRRKKEEAERQKREAEERRKAEEEREAAEEWKRREEEERWRKQEEEERQKREELERINRVEEERARMEEEKRMRKEAEGLKWEREREAEQRRKEDERRRKEEEERLNPENWNKRKYEVTNNDRSDLACIIRAMPGSLDLENITVEYVDQLKANPCMEGSEMLVSNVVNISQHEWKNVNTEFEVSLCHCAPLKAGYDVAIKMRTKEDTWQLLPSYKISFGESMKKHQFVACRVNQLTDLVVVQKIKSDSFVLNKKRMKIVSTTDNRVALEIKPNTFEKETSVSLEVQQVDPDSLKMLRNVDSNVLSTSPFVVFHAWGEETSLRQAVEVTVPVPILRNDLPQNSIVPGQSNTTPRPSTSYIDSNSPKNNVSVRPSTQGSSRYSVAPPQKTAIPDASNIHMLSKIDNQPWRVTGYIDSDSDSDLVSFNFRRAIGRLLLMRCLPGTDVKEIERLANLLDHMINGKRVRLVMRQQNDDLRDIIIAVVPIAKVKEAEQNLMCMGYSIGGTTPNEIPLREGQILTLDTRGNIHCKDKTQVFRCAYNSCLETKFHLEIDVTNKFGQKMLPNYTGVVEIFTTEISTGQKTVRPQDDGRVCLVSFQIDIPKDEAAALQFKKVNINIPSDVCVNDDLLHKLADDMYDDWEEIAKYLGLRSSRIQNIKTQTSDKPPSERNYEMLNAWVKTQKTSENKAHRLMDALQEAGRGDLKEIVSRRYQAYYCKKIIERLVGMEGAIKNWGSIGRHLNVDEGTLNDIQQKRTSDKDRLQMMLGAWLEEGDDFSTPVILIHMLKKQGLKAEADVARACLEGP